MFSKFFRALSPAKKIAFLAVFIALSVVANTLLNIDLDPSSRITFTYTVCFLSAYILGAVPAFLVGFLGDTIGFLLMPSGTFWLFGVTLGLYGFLLGIFMNYLPLQGKKGLAIKALIAFLVGYLSITVIINTVVNYYYVIIFIWKGEVKKSILVYLAERIGFQSAVYAGNVALSMMLLPVAARLCRSPLKSNAKTEDER